jgi:hypothetical protein
VASLFQRHGFDIDVTKLVAQLAAQVDAEGEDFRNSVCIRSPPGIPSWEKDWHSQGEWDMDWNQKPNSKPPKRNLVKATCIFLAILVGLVVMCLALFLWDYLEEMGVIPANL